MRLLRQQSSISRQSINPRLTRVLLDKIWWSCLLDHPNPHSIDSMAFSSPSLLSSRSIYLINPVLLSPSARRFGGRPRRWHLCRPNRKFLSGTFTPFCWIAMLINLLRVSSSAFLAFDSLFAIVVSNGDRERGFYFSGSSEVIWFCIWGTHLQLVIFDALLHFRFYKFLRIPRAARLTTRAQRR